jgi:hypothetical protein
MKIANVAFENMAHFKCLETTVTNKNLIEEGGVIRRLNSGNACY